MQQVLYFLVRRTYRFLLFFRYINRRVLLEVFRRAARQRFLGLSAEIAFNAFFAIFPALLVVLTAIGLMDLPEFRFYPLIRQISGLIPDEAVSIIQALITELKASQNQSLFSLSFITTLWVTSSVFSALMSALDQIHRVPRSRIRSFWKAKLRSLELTIVTLSLLVVALMNLLLSDLAIRFFVRQTGPLAHTLIRFWYQLSLPIALVIFAVILRTIYRYGPSARSPGTPTLPGAFIASLLWAMISGLFRLYLAHFGNYNRTYGAIGAVMVLMLWLHLSALITLVGSQLNVVVGEAMPPRLKTKLSPPSPPNGTARPAPKW